MPTNRKLTAPFITVPLEPAGVTIYRRIYETLRRQILSGHLLAKSQLPSTRARTSVGGEFAALQHFGDVPPCPEMDEMPEDARDKIMHVALPIGQVTLLMATDSLESMEHNLRAGNNFSISIDAESKEEADKIFDELSTDGRITMPLADAFWGAYFGMLTDRFGVQWMVNFDYKRQAQTGAN